MRAISQKEFTEALGVEGLAAQNLNSPVGREISFRDGSSRLIVLHLSNSIPGGLVTSIVERILKSSQKWVLATRYGCVAQLGLVRASEEDAGIEFQISEAHEAIRYLLSRPMGPGDVSTDLYLIGDCGRILITWDHSACEDGVSVAMQNVEAASSLLGDLNSLGAEMEVFYK